MRPILVLPVLLLAACQFEEGGGETGFNLRSRPAVMIEGEDSSNSGFTELADELGVPRATAVVIDDGEVVFNRMRGDGVDADGLFQAASLSKAVAAAGIVTYALDAGIGLDQDITPFVTSLDLSAIRGVKGPVTLRALLSHTAGATVGGFPGYGRGEPLPSSLDIVLGRSPANTDPVLFTRKKGNYAYAGGGYQVAQLFVEDHSGEPFAETLRRLVLNPVGMARSSFSQPVDETALGPLHIVPAELEDGPLEGGWHNYPELAAAGLWTTAEDYARFALAVGRAYRGDKDAGLKPEVARAMLTPVDRDYGLGLSIISEGGQPVSFAHGGSNEGYKASFRASALEEDAVVVLTNHPAGGRFSDEIVRGAFVALAPEGGDGEVLSREPLTSEIAERCLGDYAREGGEDAVFELTQEEGRVYILEPEGRDELIHTGGGRFVLMSAGLDIDCLEDDRGPYLLAARSARFDRLEAGR